MELDNNQELEAVIINNEILENREKQINNLHQGVQEISELFQDMSLLVTQQGQNLDNIQSNIESSVNYIESANFQLNKAKNYQYKKRSRFCCLFLLLFIIIVIILLIIIFK